MRTEAKQEGITVKLYVDALYQYDDVTPDEPHHYQWRGFTASGATKQDAKNNLGVILQNAGAVLRAV